MKKLIVVIVMFLTSSFAYSQQHLRMFGIPLDGTIESFTQKLSTKGIKKDVELSKQFRDIRAFRGSFAGYDADNIFIYYNTRTKLVYKGRVAIRRKDLDQIKIIYNELNDMIENKYEDAYYEDKDVEKYFAGRDYVIKNSNWTTLGYISLWIEKVDIYPYPYELFIDYEDAVNSAKNDASRSNDL